jgi:hypothetical protein
LKRAHQILYGIKTVLPKTTETVDLLQRTLISMAELPDPGDQGNEAQARIGREMAEELRSRSVAWSVGTSLAFELAMLSLAAWLFCRRDY